MASRSSAGEQLQPLLQRSHEAICKRPISMARFTGLLAESWLDQARHTPTTRSTNKKSSLLWLLCLP